MALVTPVPKEDARSSRGRHTSKAKKTHGKVGGPEAAKARLRERRRRKKIEEEARIQKLSLLVPSAANAASLVSLLSPRVEKDSFKKSLTEEADKRRVRDLLTQPSKE